MADNLPHDNPTDDPAAEDHRPPGPPSDLPDELPPVEPPSAGFIVQLFVVPAIIVAAVIGVYVLFGQLASAEADWRQLVTDVQSGNPHVRWRGALGLAQLLDADRQRSSDARPLAEQPEIAEALSNLYREQISISNPNEEELKQIEFLSKAVGRMDVPQVVIPVLREGMEPSRDPIVRKHSMIGLAMVAGRAHEQGEILRSPKLVDDLIGLTGQEAGLVRHHAAYVLGLIPTDEALNRLEALLSDGDQMTRVNAAIGLARNDSEDGLVVFEELLTEAAGWRLDPSLVASEEDEALYFERTLMLLNTVKAIEKLAPQLDLAERERLAGLLENVAKSSQDAVLRNEMDNLRLQLQAKA